MPEPSQLGPFGAHLVDPGFTWCRGHVLFAGGAEVAVVEQPRLLELVRLDGVASPAHVLDVVVSGAWAAAEAAQASTGGSNPRFPGVFDEAAGGVGEPACRSCLVVGEGDEVVAALQARGVRCSTGELDDAVDAVVVALPAAAAPADAGWEGVLAEHHGIVDGILADASWARSVADLGRPVRLVTLTDATTAGGRSRAQAAAQLARSSRSATDDRVSAFSIAVDPGAQREAGELAAHLVAHPEAPALAGAELVAGAGWVGLRSHPRPTGSITFGGPELPAWFDGALRGRGRDLGVRPARIVDAHVHLWDPSRTDWYPYLSGRMALDMGDTSGMARRFDVATYRSEAAGWNVTKLVNVAAATGGHSVDETIELDRRAEVDGGPDAIVGGITTGGTVAEVDAQLDRQQSAARFRGVRPMGGGGSRPPEGVLAALQERGLLFELMAHPDELAEAARWLAPFDDLTVVVEHTGWPRSAADDERAQWREGMAALAGLGGRVVCKLSGLAMPLGTMRADVLAPWIEGAIETFGVDRCLFASNFPVDGLHGTLDDLWSTYAELTAGLPETDRDKLFAGNAERVYGI